MSRFKFIWGLSSIVKRVERTKEHLYYVIDWQGLSRPSLGFDLGPCHRSYNSPWESFWWLSETEQSIILLDFLQLLSDLVFEDSQQSKLHTEGRRLLLHPQRRHRVHLSRDLQGNGSPEAADCKFWLALFEILLCGLKFWAPKTRLTRWGRDQFPKFASKCTVIIDHRVLEFEMCYSR